ncbi:MULTISPECIES: protoporphyrinogen oxidase [Micromonospora]|uniref:Coproporphyrinogen III oxidase n=1 Tax=Micromonospora solifontis TaxID=2487138 RepID=A0ABX9WPF1_9ACTN|nr:MULTISPECIES: protoporphyrinogen oxidase [Micromonospora]NES12928.1 protoporphyrinogen oxidase [Micromonospora sp. PPF5-17B]NES34754.1 protoporphyrinogen oxidase [Micromonospora solifontis]NES54853.1 protoporphyrinogen oxidase [Micromonospora sp. PPF5-6]RNM01657.1 protoporphyrinogen oxidase [Micromonospora solifontis]
MARPWRVAIVGGGITGLAAAVRLRDRAPAGTEITVYEQSGRLGGKLLTGELAGGPVEFGAESFLMRGPNGAESAAVSLVRRVGLAERIVHPTVGQAALLVDGGLRPVPGGTLVGVPGDLAKVAAVAEPAADADTDDGRPLLGPDDDTSVGRLVRARLGDQVVERLVDPMLGGVYAGRADDLSLVTTMPALARAARSEHTLVGAVRAAQAAAPRATGAPVFGTLDGGLSTLVEAAARTSGAAVRRDAAVRELHRTPAGWRLTVGPTREPEHVEVDAVLLAVPARPAARLLAGPAPEVADTVGGLDYASVALITMALPEPELPGLSGFLVPATEGLLIKASTFFTTKWGHLRRPDGLALVRASVGRYGDETSLQLTDDDLLATVHRELSKALGAALPTPVAGHVQRWGGALPQYTPGHLARVAAVRATLRTAHPTLALAGAGYDGVGIPVCVRSGETAAEEIITALGGSAA